MYYVKSAHFKILSSTLRKKYNEELKSQQIYDNVLLTHNLARESRLISL